MQAEWLKDRVSEVLMWHKASAEARHHWEVVGLREVKDIPPVVLPEKILVLLDRLRRDGCDDTANGIPEEKTINWHLYEARSITELEQEWQCIPREAFLDPMAAGEREMARRQAMTAYYRNRSTVNICVYTDVPSMDCYVVSKF